MMGYRQLLGHDLEVSLALQASRLEGPCIYHIVTLHANVAVIHLQTQSVMSPVRAGNGAMLLLTIIPISRSLVALH